MYIDDRTLKMLVFIVLFLCGLVIAIEINSYHMTKNLYSKLEQVPYFLFDEDNKCNECDEFNEVISFDVIKEEEECQQHIQDQRELLKKYTTVF